MQEELDTFIQAGMDINSALLGREEIIKSLELETERLRKLYLEHEWRDTGEC